MPLRVLHAAWFTTCMRFSSVYVVSLVLPALLAAAGSRQ